MPMSPHEFVAVLDDAIATAPRGRRTIALEMHAPGGRVTLLGHTETGTFLGHTDRGPTYGFTRRQCETMRKIILDAAADDAHQTSAPVTDDFYTGDVR